MSTIVWLSVPSRYNSGGYDSPLWGCYNAYELWRYGLRLQRWKGDDIYNRRQTLFGEYEMTPRSRLLKAIWKCLANPLHADTFIMDECLVCQSLATGQVYYRIQNVYTREVSIRCMLQLRWVQRQKCASNLSKDSANKADVARCGLQYLRHTRATIARGLTWLIGWLFVVSSMLMNIWAAHRLYTGTPRRVSPSAHCCSCTICKISTATKRIRAMLRTEWRENEPVYRRGLKSEKSTNH